MTDQDESYRLPRGILALIIISFLGLLAGIVLSFTYAQSVEQRLGALQEYVEGRGDYRDRETDRLQEQIRRGLCDLLDQLPASPLLDGPRDKYGCGPGIDAPPAPAADLEEVP